jgi:hypothetical protein
MTPPSAPALVPVIWCYVMASMLMLSETVALKVPVDASMVWDGVGPALLVGLVRLSRRVPRSLSPPWAPSPPPRPEHLALPYPPSSSTVYLRTAASRREG